MGKNIAIMLSCLAGGGAERVAAELSRFFAREGHNIFVFTEKKYDGYSAGYRFAGKVIVMTPRKVGYGKWGQAGNLYYLAKEVKRQKKKYHIDVAISFMELYNMANILSKGKERVIVRVCTTLSARTDMDDIYQNKLLIRFLYNRSDQIVVLSKYGKRDMINHYGIRNCGIRIIPNAVVPRDFDDTISWKYGDQVILNVGRIHPIKQQAILVDVMAELVAVIPEMKLLLVGYDRDEYAKKLKDRVKRLGLEKNVIFVGHVDNVEYYMYHSRVFVMTSRAEGFPNAVVEAMNQGLPIISVDFAGAAREILGVSSRLGYGKYGMVVPHIDESEKDAAYNRNIKKLTKMILKVMTNDALAEKYAAASKIRAKYYSQSKVEDLWREII